MLQVDPRVAAYVNIAFMILTGIASGTVAFAGLPDQAVSIIKTIATDLAFVIACANTVLHLYSPPVGGPLAK